MKKKILFVLLILLLPICSALTDKIIYNGWVMAGTPFVADNILYNVNYIKDTNATIIYFPEGISAVLYASYANCTQEWIYTVCQTKQKFERGGFATSPFAHTDNINVSLFLKINKTDISLDIIRKILPETIFLNDEIEIRTTIENRLQTDFANVSFADIFPASFYIKEVTGCTIRGSSVFWEGPIDREKKVLCTYKLLPSKEGVFESSATLSYDVLGKTSEKVINNSFDIQQGPFVFYIDTSNTSLKAGDPLLVNINLIALNDFTLNELKITFPSYYNITNKSDELTSFYNHVTYSSKEMKKGDRKLIFLTTVSLFEGQDKINVSLSYTYHNMIKETKKETPVNYSALVFQIYLYKKENVSVLRLSNTNNLTYKNIKVVFENYSFVLPFLDKSRYKEFEFPIAEENIRHKIDVLYLSEHKQELSRSFFLKYGESTGDETKKLIEQTEEKKEETQKTQNKFKINLNKTTVMVVLAVILLSAVLFIIINFFASKNKKSNLDKEVEKIKEEAEKERKE